MDKALELARDWYLVEQAEKQGSARADEVAKTATNLARRIDHEIVKPLAARIAALEAEVKRLTAVGRVERWEPVADDDYVAADIEIALDGCVIDVDVMDTDGEPVCYRVVLPDDIRLCRKAVTDEATD